MKEGRVEVLRVIFFFGGGGGGSSRVGHRPPKNLLLSFPLLLTQACGGLLCFTILIRSKPHPERARLLAVMTKESGAWLRALPVTWVCGWEPVYVGHMPVNTVELKSADLADTPSVVRRAWGGSRGIQR